MTNRDPLRGQELVSLIRGRTPAKADLLVWDHAAHLPGDVSVDMDTSVMRRALRDAIGLPQPPARRRALRISR